MKVGFQRGGLGARGRDSLPLISDLHLKDYSSLA